MKYFPYFTFSACGRPAAKRPSATNNVLKKDTPTLGLKKKLLYHITFNQARYLDMHLPSEN